MRAYKLHTKLSGSHELLVKLPDEFPTGDVEVIVLALEPSPDRAATGVAASGGAQRRLSEAFMKRFPMAGKLGPATIKYDPTEPLSEDEWPEECR